MCPSPSPPGRSSGMRPQTVSSQGRGGGLPLGAALLGLALNPSPAEACTHAGPSVPSSKSAQAASVALGPGAGAGAPREPRESGLQLAGATLGSWGHSLRLASPAVTLASRPRPLPLPRGWPGPSCLGPGPLSCPCLCLLLGGPRGPPRGQTQTERGGRASQTSQELGGTPPPTLGRCHTPGAPHPTP
ncbi:hypothetical protein VULLAG_LOCUS19207 [Vulpes lagopus]